MNKINSDRKVIAKISWVPVAEGGRERPPLGSYYSTVARFEKEAQKWPQEAWSIVAEFLKELNDSFVVLAKVKFLVQNAPSRLLDPGNKFELYEGRRLVARGEVLRDYVEQPIKKNRTDSRVEMQET